MSSIFTNFHTVQQKRNDVLNPAQYRSVVEAVQAMLKKYNFKEFKDNYSKLLKHIEDYSDPHHDDTIDFFDEIVTRTYNIYVNMLASPLSLEDFKIHVVPNPSFLELMRRIFLNRYLYDQVKTITGSVPQQASAYISEEWGIQAPAGLLNLSFERSSGSEESFIQLGWSQNSSPIAVIFNAEDLLTPMKRLPVLLEASSVSRTMGTIAGLKNVPFTLNLASNDITIALDIRHYPTVDTTLLTLSNSQEILKVTMSTTGIITVLLNDVVQLVSSGPILSGVVELVITTKGYGSLKTRQPIGISKQIKQILIFKDIPFTTLTFGIEYENLARDSFALRSFVVYNGYNDVDTSLTVLVPQGYAILTDDDGFVLFDADDVPLIDYDVTIPEGYDLLLDDDRSFLIDLDGSFIVEESE
jgi:hypothetical protein